MHVADAPRKGRPLPDQRIRVPQSVNTGEAASTTIPVEEGETVSMFIVANTGAHESAGLDNVTPDPCDAR
jgi:hypothetical protein